MQVRAVYCEECDWVLAKNCPHWNMECPRAKKKRKGNHKLVRSEPGYDLLVPKLDHKYWPDPDSPIDPEAALYKGDNLPNDMCYADCTCGLPWSFHVSWNQGLRRYLGSYRPRPDGEAMLVPVQPGVLLECATGCGFLASTSPR